MLTRSSRVTRVQARGTATGSGVGAGACGGPPESQGLSMPQVAGGAGGVGAADELDGAADGVAATRAPSRGAALPQPARRAAATPIGSSLRMVDPSID